LTTGRRAWFLTGKIVADDVPGFGSAIAVNGKTALVAGFETGAYAFSLSSDGWSERQELLAPTIPASTSEYGISVAVSETTAAVGDPHNGVVYVFEREGSAWSGRKEVLSDGHMFGAAVALEGDLLVVGAPGSSAAYVFARAEDDWVLQQQLAPSDTWQDRGKFGAALALSGQTLVVGAPEAGVLEGFVYGGAAYVFDIPSDLSGVWEEEKLVPSVRQPSDFFGRSLAISDGVILVGAPREWRTGPGAAYVFTNSGPSWTEQRITSEGLYPSDEFGSSVALSGDRVVVGARELQTGPRFYPGGAFVLVRTDAGWVREQAMVSTVSEERFGQAVGISDESMMVGAPFATPGSGAVYVHTLLGDAGSSCELAKDCGLGHCVSGVCCETACQGECEECSTGACLPVAAGQGAPGCTPYVCNGSSGMCPMACLTSDDCVAAYHCHAGGCTPKAGIGETCSGPEACLSGHCLAKHCSGTLPSGSPCRDEGECERGHCVDGVCCNDSCRGQCEACDLAGEEGQCLPVRGAPHAERPPCAGAGSVCEGSCDGEHIEACIYPTSATECGRMCQDGAETISSCDGAGECAADEPRSCGELVCDGERACKSSCESDRDCAGGLRCWNDGSCAPDARCGADDTFTSEVAPDATSHDCRPYICDTAGTCKTSCISSKDCAESNVCDSQQRCVPLPARAGSGCQLAPSRSPASWAHASGLAFLALLRARSRRRTLAQRRP
jgi:hypothetical protein